MNFKTPVEIARSACSAARAKAALPLRSMLVMGFLAGAYIAFGGFMMTVVTQDAAQFCGVGISKFLGGVAFAVGLTMVVVGGAELFTGNCLMPLGALNGCVPFSGVLRNWVVVYFANLLGSIFLAWIVWAAGLATGPVGVNALKIAAVKVNIPTMQMVLRGVLCNWLVVMAVWMAFSACDIVSKYVCCLLPVAAFVAMGFEHSVANMYFIALGIFIKNGAPDVVTAASIAPEKLANVNVAGYWGNIIPVTIGNIAGGALFVAVLYYVVFAKALREE